MAAPVWLAPNGQQFSLGPTTFFFAAEPLALALAPPLGPVRGDTLVSIAGADFVGTLLLCRFGGRVTPASLVDAGLLRCRSPAAPLSTVSPELSFNGVDWLANASLRFDFHAEPFATAL